MQSNLKVDMQCNKVASEANKRMRMMKRNIRFKSRSVMLPKSIVKLHLNYCVHAWRAHYRKDIAEMRTRVLGLRLESESCWTRTLVPRIRTRTGQTAKLKIRLKIFEILYPKSQDKLSSRISLIVNSISPT